jgi:hypothetical protein
MLMTEETVTKKPEPIVLSNTVVAQNDKGTLDVYVAGVRMVGVLLANIQNDGNLIMAVSAQAYRLAGRNEDKKPLVLETKDNVFSITTPLMDAYRARWAEEKAATDAPPAETPPEGDGAT